MEIGPFIRQLTVPIGYRQDDLVTGPVLPENWECDAWQAGDGERGYFLRAWNVETGEVAVAQNEQSYQLAHEALIDRVKSGGQWTIAASRNKL